MNNPSRIVGLTGTFASGKDTLANYLVTEKNFIHFSTSDILRQEALRLRGSTERPVLFEVANQLRHERGADVFVQISLEMYRGHTDKTYAGVIISGIRSIGEAETIHHEGGIMVFVDAPVETRYQRMASRQRDAESQLTLEEFKVGEEKELALADPTDKTVQNLGAMRKMADVQLVNGDDRAAFLQKALQTLNIY
jgi:dephospho-CoA kinase